MGETATCNVRLRPIDHKRLQELSKWADDIPLSRVARLAIEAYWRNVKAERNARRAQE